MIEPPAELVWYRGIGRNQQSQSSVSKLGTEMNTDLIKSEFEKAGWKQVQPRSHLNIDFDLVGYRRFTITKWNILVKVLPLLDQTAADVWKDNFERISKKSKSFIWGRCFLLCLLAEDVSTQVSESLRGDSFGLLGQAVRAQ